MKHLSVEVQVVFVSFQSFQTEPKFHQLAFPPLECLFVTMVNFCPRLTGLVFARLTCGHTASVGHNSFGFTGTEGSLRRKDMGWSTSFWRTWRDEEPVLVAKCTFVPGENVNLDTNLSKWLLVQRESSVGALSVRRFLFTST